MQQVPISAVLITLNEEKKIERALQSVSEVADEIVVVDSGSRDRTEEICRNFTSNFHHQDWLGYRDQKQKATGLATHDWILSLDADETLAPDLVQELQNWKERPGPHAGYYISRKTHFLGRWIEHTSWFPDWQLRLFDRQRGSWQGGRVHEGVEVEGSTGRLAGTLQHYTYSTISEYLKQLDTFSELAATDALEAGKKARWTDFTLIPAFVFFQNYLLKRGFLDGFPGFTVSCLASISVYFRFLKLYELQNRPGKLDQ